MHVVLRDSGGDRELVVGLRNPEATLHDVLLAALGAHVPEAVAIDGRVVDAPACTRAPSSTCHPTAPRRTGARSWSS